MFDYDILGTRLNRVSEVKDLGIILDEKLSFKPQISSTIDKASRQLGFIFKVAREFVDPLCLKHYIVRLLDRNWSSPTSYGGLIRLCGKIG